MNSNSAAFEIVRAQAEDAAPLLAYLKIIGGETENLSFGPEGVPLDTAQEAAYLRQQAESADRVQYLAKAGGEIIGTASLNRKPNRMRHRGVFGISLKKAWWGCGAASALTQAVLAFAAEHNFAQLELEVRSDNVRAIRLYEKFGFRKLCTFPAFFQLHGQPVDFDLMYLPLAQRPAEPSAGLTVRRAVRGDLPRVNELRRMVNALHAQGRPDFFRPDFCAALEARAEALLDAPDGDVLLACLGETICGFALVRYLARPETAYQCAMRLCHIEEFGVDEAYRRRGVGTALLDRCRAEARERGFSRLTLDVWEFNDAAVKFYTAAGFRPYRRFLEAAL